MTHFFIHETTGELMCIHKLSDVVIGLEGIFVDGKKYRSYEDAKASALQSAKQGAVKVKNEEEVKIFIIEKYWTSNQNFVIKPGQIYSLEGYKVEEQDEWINRDKDWSEYPIGTKAKAIGGGYWIKVHNGWKWCTGSTFPMPGGDASGLISTRTVAIVSPVSVDPEKENYKDYDKTNVEQSDLSDSDNAKDIIKDAISCYTMSSVYDSNGETKLIDYLTPKGSDTILFASEEIIFLVDEIIDALHEKGFTITRKP